MQILVRDLTARIRHIHDRTVLKNILIALDHAGFTTHDGRKSSTKQLAIEIRSVLRDLPHDQELNLNGCELPEGKVLSKYQQKKLKRQDVIHEDIPRTSNPEPKSPNQGEGVAPKPPTPARQMSFRDFVDIHADPFGSTKVLSLSIMGEGWSIALEAFRFPAREHGFIKVSALKGKLPGGIILYPNEDILLLAVKSGKLRVGTVNVQTGHAMKMYQRIATAHGLRQLYDMGDAVMVSFV
jgi:hypothetical protein